MKISTNTRGDETSPTTAFPTLPVSVVPPWRMLLSPAAHTVTLATLAAQSLRAQGSHVPTLATLIRVQAALIIALEAAGCMREPGQVDTSHYGLSVQFLVARRRRHLNGKPAGTVQLTSFHLQTSSTSRLTETFFDLTAGGWYRDGTRFILVARLVFGRDTDTEWKIDKMNLKFSDRPRSF